jgi:AraC-like DNA-binding protein
MRHAVYRPTPALERYIDFVWVADDYVAEAPRERVLPTGAQVLIVHLGGGPMQVYPDEQATAPLDASGVILCGARRTPVIIGTSFGPTLGVHFKAGGARPFFDVPAAATSEQVVSVDALWGRSVGSLRERLMETSSSVERARLAQDFLLGRARQSFELEGALRASLDAFEEPDLPSVAEVNRRTGLSPKRLSALFHEEIGLSPKAYWRVRRFRAALRDLERGAMRGSTLAYEHGYCDQAHFLREFRALAGSSPREYLAARVAGTDHVSLFG